MSGKESKKTYRVKGQVIDVPEKNVDQLLKKYPDAEEMASYIINGDTVDVPKANEAILLEKYPDAEPTYSSKKKVPTTPDSEEPAKPSLPSGEGVKPYNPPTTLAETIPQETVKLKEPTQEEAIEQEYEFVKGRMLENDQSLTKANDWIAETQKKLEAGEQDPTLIAEYEDVVKGFNEKLKEQKNLFNTYGDINQWKASKLLEKKQLDKKAADIRDEVLMDVDPTAYMGSKFYAAAKSFRDRFVIPSAMSVYSQFFTPMSDEEIQERVANLPADVQVKVSNDLKGEREKAKEIKTNAMKMAMEATERSRKNNELANIPETFDEIEGGLEAINYTINVLTETAGQVPISVATMGGSSMIMSSGLMYQQAVEQEVSRLMEEQGISKEEALSIAIEDKNINKLALNTGAAAVAALDLVGAKGVMGTLSSNAKKGVVKDFVKANVVKNVLKKGAPTAGEMATEVAQEFIEAGTISSATGDSPTINFSTPNMPFSIPIDPDFFEGMDELSVEEIKEIAIRSGLGAGGVNIMTSINSQSIDQKVLKAIDEDPDLRSFALEYIDTQAKNGDITPQKAEQLKTKLNADMASFDKLKANIPEENMEEAIALQNEYEAVTEQIKENSALKPFLNQKKTEIEEKMAELAGVKIKEGDGASDGASDGVTKKSNEVSNQETPKSEKTGESTEESLGEEVGFIDADESQIETEEVSEQQTTTEESGAQTVQESQATAEETAPVEEQPQSEQVEKAQSEEEVEQIALNFDEEVDNLSEEEQTEIIEEYEADESSTEVEELTEGSEGETVQETPNKKEAKPDRSKNREIKDTDLPSLKNNNEEAQIGLAENVAAKVKTIELPDGSKGYAVSIIKDGEVVEDKNGDTEVEFTEDEAAEIVNYLNKKQRGFKLAKTPKGKVETQTESKKSPTNQPVSFKVFGKEMMGVTEEGGRVRADNGTLYTPTMISDVKPIEGSQDVRVKADKSSNKVSPKVDKKPKKVNKSVDEKPVTQKTESVNFDDELKVFKRFSSETQKVRLKRVNQKLKDAVKSGEITKQEADNYREEFERLANDKVLGGLNTFIDDLSGLNASIPFFKQGLVAVREAYLVGRDINKAIKAGIAKIKELMGDSFNKDVEADFKLTVRAWLKEGKEKMATPEGREFVFNENFQQLITAFERGDFSDFGKAVESFLKEVPKGTLSDFRAKKLAEKAANIKTPTDLKGFRDFAEKTFKEAALRDYKRQVTKKVRRAKVGKGKSNLGQYAKSFSKLNLSGVEDIELLERIEKIAKDLQSNSPTTTVKEINEVMSEVNDIQNQDQKSLLDKIKTYQRRLKDVETPAQFVNAEIERQTLLSELVSTEEDIPGDLIDQLNEEIIAPDFKSDMSSMKLAALASGNLNRAKNAVNAALKNGTISEANSEELLAELEGAIEYFNQQVANILKAEKAKIKNNAIEAKKAMDSMNKVQKAEVELLLDLDILNDAAWVTRYNKALESIASGNVPVTEITSLREYAMYKSDKAIKLADSIASLKPKKRSVREWVNALATKEIGQKARNVLNTQDKTIFELVYSPLSNAADGARKLATDLLNPFVKVAKRPYFAGKAYHKRMTKAAMIGLYMREASMQGMGKMADGVEVGFRDIFGIYLGEKAALDQAGFSEEGRRFFDNGQVMANYDRTTQKLIRKIWNELPKVDGAVQVDQITPDLLDTKGRKVFDALMGMFDRGAEMQEISNLRRNKEFEKQPFYFTSKRLGRDPKIDKPTREVDKFSEQASVGKEKVSESLKSSVGAYSVDLNSIAAYYADQVAIDYTYSKQQPVQNALMNSAINILGENNIARAIKKDYAASLDFEASAGNVPTWLQRMLGARYAASLFDPIRSVVESVAAMTSIPLKTRSVRSLIDPIDKTGWDVLRRLESDFGMEIASFQAKEVERRGLKEKRSKNNIIAQAGRVTMSAPEYFTSIAAFMPEFRREFKNQTGEVFNSKKFLSDPSYRKENKAAIDSGVASGQEMVYRIYGAKSKGASRRSVEIMPSWVNKLFGGKNEPVTIKADSPYGRIISFFGNFSYREQGEFFQSLYFAGKNVAEGVKQTAKGDTKAASKEFGLAMGETMNSLGVFTNAMTYAYGMGIYYALQLMLLGDDEDEERGAAMMDEMGTTEGLVDNMISQAAFLATGKYGKASRTATVGALSAMYWNAIDRGAEDEAGLYLQILQDNFYVYRPLDVTNKYTSLLYLSKEFAPALTYGWDSGVETVKSGVKLKEEQEAAVAADFLFNATNLALMAYSGTQLPLTRQFKRAIETEKKKSESKQSGNVKIPTVKLPRSPN